MSDDEAEEVIDNYVIEYVGEDMGEEEENKRKFVARDGVAAATFNNGDTYKYTCLHTRLRGCFLFSLWQIFCFPEVHI